MPVIYIHLTYKVSAPDDISAEEIEEYEKSVVRLIRDESDDQTNFTLLDISHSV